MSYYLAFINNQLKIANRLKVLELCLKYPEQEDMIKTVYINLRKEARELDG